MTPHGCSHLLVVIRLIGHLPPFSLSRQSGKSPNWSPACPMQSREPVGLLASSAVSTSITLRDVVPWESIVEVEFVSFVEAVEDVAFLSLIQFSM